MPAKSFAIAVVKTLVEAGYIAYFAGGWIRDFLMQHPSDDIDIATNATVETIQSLFPKTIPIGVAFGIVIVIEGGHHFEVATFRKETGHVDGRRPTSIELATPQEDAQRRDFTINGMFWDPLKEELLDYVGGESDIRKKVVRAIGDPHERFLEDRLRMMRAVRYCTRFGFEIESNTRSAILVHAQSLFPSVAVERVWQEFKKMSQFAHFDKGLTLLHELQLLSVIFPSLKGVSVKEIGMRVSFLAHFPKNTPAIAELLELFPTHSLQELLALCEYLKLSKQEKELVQFLYRAKHLLNMPSDWLKQLESVEWAHFYAHPYSATALSIAAAHVSTSQRKGFLQEHQQRSQALETAIHRIRSNTPVVRAQHLMQAGIVSGKQMGLLLKEAERIAVNQQLEDPEMIIQLLKNSPIWHS